MASNARYAAAFKRRCRSGREPQLSCRLLVRRRACTGSWCRPTTTGSSTRSTSAAATTADREVPGRRVSARVGRRCRTWAARAGRHDCLSGEDKPLHCEGEVTCLPGTQCLFVRQGTCVEDYTWMTYAAKPVLEPVEPDGRVPEERASSRAPSTRSSSSTTPASGSCSTRWARSRRRSVGALPRVWLRARRPPHDQGEDARGRGAGQRARLIYSSVAPPSMGLSPRQCGTNPWQTAPAADEGAELELVDTWLAGLAAKVNLARLRVTGAAGPGVLGLLVCARRPA